MSAVFFARGLALPDTGLVRYDPEVTAVDGALLYEPTSPFSAPLSAGVVAGSDRILEMNGRAVSGTRDLVRQALAVRSFEPYQLLVQAPGQAPRTIDVRPYFRPSRADWSFELVFCLVLGAAAFTLWRRPLPAGSVVPLLLSVLLALLFTCITPFSLESLPANVLANAGNISSWLLVIFAMYFPSRRGPRPVRRLVVAGVCALYAAFCLMRALLYAQWMTGGAEAPLAAYRQLGRLVIFSDGAAYAILGVLLGGSYARSRLPRDRRMLQWMIAAVLIAFPPYFLLDQLPLVLGGSVHHVGLGSLAQLFLSVLPLFLLLALVRSSAMNFRSFLARYGLHGTLLVLAVIGFGTLFLPLSDVLAGAYRVAAPVPQVLSAAIIVAVLGAARYPLERLFHPRWEKPVDGLPGLVGLAEASATSTQRLEETRAVFRGIARTLRRPVHLLAESAAAGTDPEHKAAGAEASFFLSTLEYLAGSAAAPQGLLSIQAAVRGAVAQLGTRYPSAAVEVSGDGGGRFLCRSDEVVQAIRLLLENAVEAAARPGAAVRVLCSRDSGRAEIRVIDDGPGLGTLARRRLFRPFWTTKPGHRGLGLYMARLLVERNEGGLSVGNAPEGGAVARMAFPLAAEDA